MSDHKYENESYLGDPEDDELEPKVHDLGFIVDDRDDRRIQLVDDTWDRLGNLDTDEALEVNANQAIPLDENSGAPPVEAFATSYNLGHLEAEEQEEDFVETSMLATDPDGGAGADDFTSGSLRKP